jgi:hypothetical protein
MRASRLIHSYLIATVLAIATPIVSAQTVTTGDVTGTVVDPAGAVLANAEITLKNTEVGEARTVFSSAAGRYRFTFVRSGKYEVFASSRDLVSDTAEFDLAVGQVASVDLVMKLRAQREVVNVSGTVSLLDSDDANFTYTLSSRQLEMLPLPGGDLVAVAYTAPGVVIAPGGPNVGHGTGNFAAAGIGSASNLFTVNGADDMDPYSNANNSGATNLLLGANEIQQAAVVQNPYEGQYGRQAGAQVNYVSKSGANAYHGDLTYSYNGTVLNANDYFANATNLPRPHAVSNQYAAALGGRIIRDKLFFFVDTEGLRYALPGNVSIVAVPSQALRDYTLKTVLPSQAPLYKQGFALYNAAPGRNRAVPVSNGNGVLQDSTGRLGCGTLSGTSFGNGGTFGTNISCADAYAVYVPSQTSEWLISGRVDYNLTRRQSLFLRLKTDHGFQPELLSPISPLFNVVSTQPDYEGQLNYTFAITPRLVTNFIGSTSYYNYTFGASNLSAAVSAFPTRFNVHDGGANGAGGFTSVGVPAAFPTGRRIGQLQIVDDISYSAGNHLLKAGVNYRYNQEADLTNSAFTRIGVFAFSGLDEFASGALNPASGSTYQQNFTAAPVAYVHLYNLGVYAQDQLAVTPHLKFTGTLRFDRTGNPHCVNNCFARLTSPFAEIKKGVDVPYNTSIQSGLSHAFYAVEPIVVQPRMSFAYNPGWSKGSVIRGGLGVFSDLYPGSFASLFAGNAPNGFLSLVRQGLVATAGSGSAPAIAAAAATAFLGGFAAGATLPQLQQAVAPAQFFPPQYFSIPVKLQNPRYVEWSLELDHQLAEKNAIGVRYSGNHGYHTFIGNAAANASVQAASYPNGFGGLPTTTPDPRFGVVTQVTNDGYSNYNGMTVFARRMVASGFQGQISYTWSHSLDLVSNGGVAQFSYSSGFLDQLNPYDLRSLNYSSSDYDVRHNLAADFVWDVPSKFYKRELNTILGGWSLASKMNAHTGMPFSVYSFQIPSLVSSLGGYVLAEVIDPNARTNCSRSSIQTPCFTPAAFATATAQTTFGNWPRNSFRGPGYFDLDLSLYKTVAIHERVHLRIGATGFNVLNHPNFADPNNFVPFSGLGLINSTVTAPSGPYGLFVGPSGRALLVTGKLNF